MEQQNNNNPQNSRLTLLKIGSKKQGFIILIFGIIILFIRAVSQAGLQFGGEANRIEKPDPLKLVAYAVILGGLLFFAAAREKKEDEYVMMIRLKAMRFAFLAGALYVSLRPFISLFTGTEAGLLDASQALIGIVIVYLATFYYKLKNT